MTMMSKLSKAAVLLQVQRASAKVEIIVNNTSQWLKGKTDTMQKDNNLRFLTLLRRSRGQNLKFPQVDAGMSLKSPARASVGSGRCR